MDILDKKRTYYVCVQAIEKGIFYSVPISVNILPLELWYGIGIFSVKFPNWYYAKKRGVEAAIEACAKAFRKIGWEVK